ncbi:MAG: riboflavin biosynthesis protein RibF [Coriobacteriales bacterium]|jgi:riboflavin kinase/FMN adenylyltransferase
MKSEGKSRVIRVGQGEFVHGDSVCALGVFDGVHAGHRTIISDCIEKARETGANSVILTFDVDPVEVLSPDKSARKLLSNDDRIEMLRTLGADVVAIQHFDHEFARMHPLVYIQEAITKFMTPKCIFVGKDFRFGHKAAGDLTLLKRELYEFGCAVVGEELYCELGAPVTATRIRNLIEEGALDSANELLGRPHFFRATVAHGREVGRTLGFPTANLVAEHDYVKMCDGVYAGYVEVDGTWHRASISVGVPKTFGDIAWTTEAHIIDFDADIYDAHVRAAFARYLRPMVKFDSPAELMAQIARDTQTAADLPDFE